MGPTSTRSAEDTKERRRWRARPHDAGANGDGVVWPRLFPALLGVWLIVSAYAWPHAPGQVINMFICGGLAILFAGASLRFPPARYLNGLLGLWVFISALALSSRDVATPWNELLVGSLIVAASLVPTRGATYRWPA